jgi:hypothetical protein
MSRYVRRLQEVLHEAAIALVALAAFVLLVYHLGKLVFGLLT